MALFGKTAKQWRDANTDKKGNIRDHAIEYGKYECFTHSSGSRAKRQVAPAESNGDNSNEISFEASAFF